MACLQYLYVGSSLVSKHENIHIIYTGFLASTPVEYKKEE